MTAASFKAATEKPPSYELTSESTIEFVCARIQIKKKEPNRSEILK